MSDPENFASDFYSEVFRTIDELVHIIKPTNVLYLAMDGVAPRPKLMT